jgi:hypothetical protein
MAEPGSCARAKGGLRLPRAAPILILGAIIGEVIVRDH